MLELWSKQEWEALEDMVSPRLLKVLRCGAAGSVSLAPACNLPATSLHDNQIGSACASCLEAVVAAWVLRALRWATHTCTSLQHA